MKYGDTKMYSSETVVYMRVLKNMMKDWIREKRHANIAQVMEGFMLNEELYRGIIKLALLSEDVSDGFESEVQSLIRIISRTMVKGNLSVSDAWKIVLKHVRYGIRGDADVVSIDFSKAYDEAAALLASTHEAGAGSLQALLIQMEDLHTPHVGV